MFNSFGKGQEFDENGHNRRTLIESIVIKVIPLIFVAVLVYFFLFYGALIALTSMFGAIVGYYLISHGVKTAVKGRNRIVESREKRRYYPHDKG